MIDQTVKGRQSPRAHVSASVMLGELNAVQKHIDLTAGELPTGFTPLDNVLDGGLSVGDLCVIGGVPGVGKTIVALQWARNIAAAGHRVLFCCYEHNVPTLLGRLVALEVGNLNNGWSQGSDAIIRSSIKAIMAGSWSAAHPGAEHPVMRAAMAEVEEYGHRLVLSQLSTATGGLDAIHGRMSEADEPYRAVFVDHVQKLGVPGTTPGIERWTVAVEELKETALTRDCLIVAVSAVSQASLKAKRVRLDGFRGSEAIAHEADVAIVLNSKLRIVSRSHLAFDPTLYGEFAKAVVLTVEKNRRGPAPVDVEFDKDFARFRFVPKGRYVAERLVDDILVHK